MLARNTVQNRKLRDMTFTNLSVAITHKFDNHNKHQWSIVIKAESISRRFEMFRKT